MSSERRTLVRQRPRVEDTESSKNKVNKSVKHRKVIDEEDTNTRLGAHVFSDGNVRIAVQRSELVPVAQYANVTVGPILVEWNLSGLDLTPLIDVEEWSEEQDGEIVFDYESLSDPQKRVYDQLYNCLRATGKVIEHVMAEDRADIEESVRLRNQKDAEDAKSRRR